MLQSFTITQYLLLLLSVVLFFERRQILSELRWKDFKLELLYLTILFLSFIFGLAQSVSRSHLYSAFFIFLCWLFTSHKRLKIFVLPFLVLMILNLILCVIEMGLGYITLYDELFTIYFKTFSRILATTPTMMYETYAISRRIPVLELLFRPVGLFGNIHLSSYALFLFYTFLEIRRDSKFLRITLATMIFLSGSIQTILCLVTFLGIISIFKYRRGIPLFFVCFLLLAFLFSHTYISGTLPAHHNIIVIALESLGVIGQIPLSMVLFGTSEENVSKFLSTVSGMRFPSQLIELGFIRYPLSYGIVNLSLLGAIFVHRFRKIGYWSVDSAALIAGMSATLLHYFMLSTFVGMIFSLFVIFSINPKGSNRNLSED